MNQKYLGIIVEAIIPLLGFYYWHWNLAFILCFYFLEAISQEVLSYLQSRFLRDKKGENPPKVLKLQSLLVLLLGMSSWVIWLEMRGDQKGFWVELVRFMEYEDWGIPQGIVIIPLLVLNVFLKYTIEFVKREAWRGMNSTIIWRNQMANHLQLLLVALMALLPFEWKEEYLLWMLIAFPLIIEFSRKWKWRKLWNNELD